MYGKDYQYAQSRLVDSIVRIAKTGEPVIVNGVLGDGRTDVTFLSNHRQALVSLDDLNLKPVPLGWCNMARGATYLARIPKRNDWRQGIRAQTCYSSHVVYRNIPHSSLCACIRGEYPTLKDVLSAPGNILRAWSRKWATDGNALFYGTLGVVGIIKDNLPLLDDEFSFLRERLEAILTGANSC